MAQLLALQIPWRGQADLVPALAALVDLNCKLIPAYRIPLLYQSGVRYQREGKKADGSYFERWLTAPEVFRYGHGDCEDLASWRASELRLAGDSKAIALAVRSTLGWHIVTRHGDGTIEDPSRKLGM